MNPIPEPAVRPRRNLLNALWISALTLWGSTALEAKKKEEPDVYTIVGRLCLDKDFRNTFFHSKSADEALKDPKIASMIKHSELKPALKRIIEGKPNSEGATRNTPGGGTDAAPMNVSQATQDSSGTNPVETACAKVEEAIITVVGKDVNGGPRMPCKPWPCG